MLFPLGKCRKSGDHPKEHLVESGYKPNMKFGSLIIPLYFGYTLKTKVKKSGKFYYLFPHFQQLKTSKITFFFFDDNLSIQEGCLFVLFVERPNHNTLHHTLGTLKSPEGVKRALEVVS